MGASYVWSWQQSPALFKNWQQSLVACYVQELTATALRLYNRLQCSRADCIRLSCWSFFLEGNHPARKIIYTQWAEDSLHVLVLRMEGQVFGSMNDSSLNKGLGAGDESLEFEAPPVPRLNDRWHCSELLILTGFTQQKYELVSTNISKSEQKLDDHHESESGRRDDGDLRSPP